MPEEKEKLEIYRGLCRPIFDREKHYLEAVEGLGHKMVASVKRLLKVIIGRP
jgi:hypothetical protein